MDSLCFCGMSTAGHAINCPLRPLVTIIPTITIHGSPLSVPSKEWQAGYDAGYEAGRKAAQAEGLRSTRSDATPFPWGSVFVQ
jgi:hypothetical protein